MKLVNEHDVDPGGSLTRLATEEFVTDFLTIPIDSYTLATLPDASTVSPNTLIYVGDAPVGDEFAVSNGVTWRHVAPGNLDAFDGSTIFDPADIPGLVAAYDFSQLGLADNDPIAVVQDLSPNNYNLAEATAGFKPIFKTAIQNGLGVARHDGVDDRLISGVAFVQAQPVTVFAVFCFRAAYAADVFAFDTKTGAQLSMLRTATDKVSLWAGTAYLPSSAITPQAWHVYTGEYNGTASKLYVDGVLKSAAGNPGTNGFGGVSTGISNSGSSPGAVDFGYLIFVQGLLSGTDRANVEAGLKAQWGTP